MNKRKIAAGLVASLIALVPVSMHAEDCCIPEYLATEPLCDDMACAIYSQYAGIELDCGWNVYTWGEFLYWRPITSTSWVVVKSEGAPIIIDSTSQELAHKMGYRPAFRVGIGMSLHDFDDWMLNADYTWYHHGFTKTFSAAAPFNLASTLPNFTPIIFPNYSSITNKFNFNYDIVGVSIQRPNYLGQRVILSPFLGLKWIHRDNKISQNCTQINSGLVDSARTTFSFSSVGIAAGFDGYFLMGCGTYLLGKADVAIIYAYQRKLFQISIPAIPTPMFPVNVQKQHIEHIDILGKGGLGIGWGSYFCCNRYHVDFSATFDFLADVSKNGFAVGMFIVPPTMLMGLTIHGQFDF